MTIIVKSVLKGTAVAHRALDQQHALTLAVYARAMGAQDIFITENGIDFGLETYKVEVADLSNSNPTGV